VRAAHFDTPRDTPLVNFFDPKKIATGMTHSVIYFNKGILNRLQSVFPVSN
jgi:hypothetical protein